MKIDKFSNNVNLDEVAQNEPPHLDLHCLPSLADENFVICFPVGKEFNTFISCKQ